MDATWTIVEQECRETRYKKNNWTGSKRVKGDAIVIQTEKSK